MTKTLTVGKWTVTIDTRDPRADSSDGYFTNQDETRGGEIWLDQRGNLNGARSGFELADYDGLSVLPLDVCQALEQMGINVPADFWER